jgi:hypothetical protein
MRVPFLLLPVALALAAPLAALADDAPRVIFCSGDCFAVDARGARTPAPKGTRLLPGQRLETGPGSYAQVKLGTDTAFGVGERARVRLDRDGVFLDEGRLRVVGEQGGRPFEVRTDDSKFVLRGADIEMRKSGPTGPASPLLVKLNAGDASVSGTALTNGGVQLVTAGSVIPGAPLPTTEVRATTQGRRTDVAQAGGLPTIVQIPMTPVALPPMPTLPPLPPVAKGPVVPPTLTLPPMVRMTPPPPPPPVLTGAQILLKKPVIDTTTLRVLTLEDAIKITIDPTLSTTTLSTVTLSPTLSTSLSTTSLDTTVFTTKTTTTTTTTTTSPTTTYKLLSPTLSTSTLLLR